MEPGHARKTTYTRGAKTNVGPDQRADDQRPHKTTGTNHPDQPTHNGEDHGKETTNMSGPTGPNMGPPRRERDSGDTNPMAYQDHMGTEIQNQEGQRTTDKTTRPGLTGKEGRRAHQNQWATTAHQRQPGQREIRGPRTQTTKPSQCPRIQKTGRSKDEAKMATRTPRDSKSPQGHGQGPERKGLERERERKRERELDVDPKAPPPPGFASRGANPILPIIQARQGPIPEATTENAPPHRPGTRGRGTGLKSVCAMQGKQN